LKIADSRTFTSALTLFLFSFLVIVAVCLYCQALCSVVVLFLLLLTPAFLSTPRLITIATSSRVPQDWKGKSQKLDRVVGKVRIIYIKACKHMYNRHESGTEVDGAWWTAETMAQGRERGTTSSCKMGLWRVRGGQWDDTCLTAAGISLFCGNWSPVEVHAALRTRSGSTIGTGSGLWS